MRVWDLPVTLLCDKHLNGQHLEIHTIASVIVNEKKGYAKHPETMRWRDHLTELWWVHDATAVEMGRRGFNHKSPMLYGVDRTPSFRDVLGTVDPILTQINEIEAKGCMCNTNVMRIEYDSYQIEAEFVRVIMQQNA